MPKSAENHCHFQMFRSRCENLFIFLSDERMALRKIFRETDRHGHVQRIIIFSRVPLVLSDFVLFLSCPF